ncbi:MAG TPA: hypothetical protein VFQ87_19540 [Bradyrhizobium sp.]|jgi:hypothetical protein|nr:hypothetical protein [Bradyrhizobium sp.]
MTNDRGQNVMGALSGLNRNDMVRVVALASVAVPLMAYAQPGSAAKAVKPSTDAAPSARSRKPVKPRVAHARERRPLNLSYAANAGTAQVWMPGW